MQLVLHIAYRCDDPGKKSAELGLHRRICAWLMTPTQDFKYAVLPQHTFSEHVEKNCSNWYCQFWPSTSLKSRFWWTFRRSGSCSFFPLILSNWWVDVFVTQGDISNYCSIYRFNLRFWEIGVGCWQSCLNARLHADKQGLWLSTLETHVDITMRTYEDQYIRHFWPSYGCILAGVLRWER